MSGVATHNSLLQTLEILPRLLVAFMEKSNTEREKTWLSLPSIFHYNVTRTE